MPGAHKDEAVGSFVTRTSTDGTWAVPGRESLHFLILLPEAGPVFGDEYDFRAPTGEELTVPAGSYSEGFTDNRKLRVEWRQTLRRRPFVSPVVGVMGGGGQVVSAHIGFTVLQGKLERALGLRADVSPGVTGIGAGAGVIANLFGGAFALPGMELNMRALRSWSGEHAHRWSYGPEIAVNLLSLRFTVAALADTLGARVRDRRFVIGFGFGYL